MTSRPALALATAATFVAISPTAAAEEVPSCGTPAWVAVERAVETWCAGQEPMRHAYDDWSLTQTRQQACTDLRDALYKCSADIYDAKQLERRAAPGLVVVTHYPDDSVIYWQAHLVRRGRGYRVTFVDFVEDNTP